MAMNTPLMNIRGNLTTFETNIIFAGVSVGSVESRLPIAEKQMADKIISTVKTAGLIMLDPKTKTPKDSGIKETSIPYENPAMMSPEIMAVIDAGVETRRSKVLLRVSQGAITGVEEKEMKKSVMPSMPGKRMVGEIFLPNARAQNRQMGKKMPKIKTGGLR